MKYDFGLTSPSRLSRQRGVVEGDAGAEQVLLQHRLGRDVRKRSIRSSTRAVRVPEARCSRLQRIGTERSAAAKGARRHPFHRTPGRPQRYLRPCFLSCELELSPECLPPMSVSVFTELDERALDLAPCRRS